MTWDAVVIGAGPSGSATARALSLRGRRVLLVDRARFPRPKVCGGCLNARALAALARLGIEDVPGTPLERLALHAGRRTANVALPGGLAVSRTTFDHELVEAARAAGAVVREGCHAAPGAPGVVRIADETVHADIVVLATGLDGTPRSGSRIGAGARLTAPAAFVEPRTIHMVCGRGGYVGFAGLEAAAALAPRLVADAGGVDAAVNGLLARAGLPAVAGEWRGTPALTRRPARLAGERMFRVGDAAGYVEPFTGEGIAWALEGALALASIVADGWHDGADAVWERMHARTVRQRLCRVVTRTLRVPGAAAAAVGLLRRAPRLAAPFVEAASCVS